MAKPKPIEFYVDENGCHICTSHRGITSFNGKSIHIHTYVYLTKVCEEIPEGYIVVRKCGNKKCINPEHLTLTTRKETAPQIVKKYVSHPIDFDIDPLTDCFNCTSHPANKKGYHLIKVNNKTRQVHRFVYEQMFGEIPEGLVVRHKCDNPHCINPEHLELGTPADNTRDMVERNRQAKGSKNAHAKLTEEDVREIKRRLAAGEGVKYLAKVYGVYYTTICEIKSGRNWKHVTID